MKIKIAVDANPIISALIGGISREILFNHRFDFITTEYSINEVGKYLPFISEKSGVGLQEIQEMLSLLPIKIYSLRHYKSLIGMANKIIGNIDEKDVDILALSFKEDCFLWSEDKHFRNKEIKLIRTKDLL